jgi:ammonia channel protein AmtB
MLAQAGQLFKDQISTNVVVETLLYSVGAMSLLLIVLGLALIDGGLVRAKNTLDTWVHKFAAAAVAGIAFSIIGYGIWNWQFNEAFGVAEPLKEAIKSWWIGGSMLTTYPQFIDPKVAPNADVFQVFMAFFIGYAMIAGVFVASAGVERLKPIPLYVMAAITGGILVPVAAYLTWGPVGPLTNEGLHDFSGVFSLYILVGVISLVMSWRLRPRLGAFAAHERTSGPAPQNLAAVGAGALVVMVAIPVAMLGCGFVFPDTLGFVGITGTTSGMGLVMVNVFVTFLAGIAAGAILSYRTKNAVWVLLGPIAAYVAGGTLFDVADPWQTGLVTFFGPIVAYGTYRLLQRMRIDDSKIAPLTLGPGIYGAIASGVVAWNVDTGGFPGITSGEFAFQHAEISPWMQLAGVGVIIALAAIPTLLLCLVFERVGGLRVSEADELEGIDAVQWGVRPGPDVAVGGGTGRAPLIGTAAAEPTPEPAA